MVRGSPATPPRRALVKDVTRGDLGLRHVKSRLAFQVRQQFQRRLERLQVFGCQEDYVLG